jgi:hypothetical protein
VRPIKSLSNQTFPANQSELSTHFVDKSRRVERALPLLFADPLALRRKRTTANRPPLLSEAAAITPLDNASYRAVHETVLSSATRDQAT